MRLLDIENPSVAAVEQSFRFSPNLPLTLVLETLDSHERSCKFRQMLREFRNHSISPVICKMSLDGDGRVWGKLGKAVCIQQISFSFTAAGDSCWKTGNSESPRPAASAVFEIHSTGFRCEIVKACIPALQPWMTPVTVIYFCDSAPLVSCAYTIGTVVDW